MPLKTLASALYSQLFIGSYQHSNCIYDNILEIPCDSRNRCVGALDILVSKYHIGSVLRDRGCLTDLTAAIPTEKVRAGTPAATKSRPRGISLFLPVSVCVSDAALESRCMRLTASVIPFTLATI
jgi:hypothetical protein